MKKLLIATLASAAFSAQAQTVDNWTAAGAPVRNSTGLCWRNSSWTPATAHPDCDGALQPVVAAAKVDVKAPAAVIANRAASAVAKHTFQAETLFDFDKSVVKPAGKAMLNSLVAKLRNINVEIIVAVGHTDSVGTDAYNQKLGQRRADAVKAYLVSQGVPANRIYTDSKGESQPVADNRTREGRAKNRRVEVEVVGSAK